MEISKLSSMYKQPIETPASYDAEIVAELSPSKFRWVPISPDPLLEPRPVPVITAEIRRDMDNLCHWLHEVRRVHSAMARLRADRKQSQPAWPSLSSVNR